MDAFVAIGIFIPFVGTSLGALMALGMKNQMKPLTRKILYGFASGIMISAAFFSLLGPAVEYLEETGRNPWFAPSLGFALGIAFLLILDTVIPHLHKTSDTPEGMRTGKLKKSTMLAFAITLHNIPEGMAVGVVFAGALTGNEIMTLSGGMILAVVIALHNFPEGAVVSMSLRDSGVSKRKSVLIGMGSGVVEPIAALITLVITSLIHPILPYVLAFAAGAMIYVVIEELVPDAMEGEHSNIAVIGAAIGFILLMAMELGLH